MLKKPAKTTKKKAPANPFKKLAIEAANIADGKKAEDIVVIDLAGQSTLCDYIVIASVDSTPQMNAAEEEISKTFKTQGIHKLHIDGAESSSWQVLDYGGILIHVMLPEIREFYSLDKIFSYGKRVPWQKPAPRKTAKKPAAKKKKSGE
ncbi:MAG: ribosome silencing factor [Elusimicrobiaceae bacterium]